MAPRGDTARLAHRRRSSLQLQLSVGNAVLQQCSRGVSPVVSALDLSAAARAATALAAELQSGGSPQELSDVWEHASQDAAAYLALFSVALRESSPYATGDGPGPVYANIRNSYTQQLIRLNRTVGPAWWGRVCCDLLVPVLLRTDVLQCYSRLLAQAAQQLKPAAAGVLAAVQPSPGESEWPSGALRANAEAAGAGGSNRRQPRSRPPSLIQVELVLRNVLHLVEHLSFGLRWYSPPVCGPAAQPTMTARAQLQSSWVLEHWAQVVLLSTAVIFAEGDGATGVKAVGMQANLLYTLCELLSTAGLGLTDFLRHPCGCALAAIHMAQLCAALDGGDAFGAAKPEGLLLPSCGFTERMLARCVDEQAARYDTVACEANRAVGLCGAVVIVKAWTALLSKAHEEGPDAEPRDPAVGEEATAEVLPGGPRDTGSSARRGERVAAPAHGAAEGLSCCGTAAGVEREGECGASTSGALAAAGVSIDKLPPFNRPAAFDVCLRLAKGVLAQWGAPLQGILLGHAPGRMPPLLPKVSSAVLLHHALACARLALLPAVRGRERVPRRARAQLRAWWGTYVVAAQHPEALMVALPDLPERPAWTREGPRASISAGAASRPSADATAAIEAGLLPCLAVLLDRMGTGSSGGAVWCPPTTFPGVRPCLADVLQLGPLGQVGQLVSAVGRRLRAAVGDMRAAVAEGERSGMRVGRLMSVGRLADVLHEAMWFACVCLNDLYLGPVYGGFDLDFEERPAAVVGAMGAAGRGAVGDGDGGVGARVAAGFKRLAVRAAFIMAELLPALSLAVRLCTELTQQGQGPGGAGAGRASHRDTAQAGPEVIQSLAKRAAECAGHALSCTMMLMAKLSRHAAGEQQGTRGDGGSSTADTEWRQLLLRDVRLMELLGAGVALVQLGATTSAGAGTAEAGWGGRGAAGDASAMLRDTLAQVLPVAAFTFPAEFRSALGAGAAGVSGPGPAAGAHGATSSGGQLEPTPCLSLAAIREVLKSVCGTDEGPQYKALAAVVGDGCAARQEEGVRRWGRHLMESPEWGTRVMTCLALLPPPGEARAGVAAAVEAEEEAAAARGPAAVG